MKMLMETTQRITSYKLAILFLTLILCASPGASAGYRITLAYPSDSKHTYFLGPSANPYIPSPAVRGGIIDGIIFLFQIAFQFVGYVLHFLVDAVIAVFRFIGDIFVWLWHGIELIFTTIGDGFKWSAEIAQNILRNADQPIKTVDLASLSDEQLSFAKEVVSADISVFASLPRNEDEMIKVMTDIHEFDSVVTELDETRNRLGLHGPSTYKVKEAGEVDESATVDSFISTLENNDSPFVSIIGHNESGNFRLFGDREKHISIEEMANLCVAFVKRCLFISCNSQRYLRRPRDSAGLMWELSYLQAAEILESISQRARRKGRASLVDVHAMLLTEEIVVHARPKIEFIVATGSLGGGVGVAGLQTSRNDCPKTL